MSFYQTVSRMAMGASALLLVAGCSGRKEVALAHHQDTIRKQEQQLAQERAEKEKAAQLNDELAKQNTAIAQQSADAQRAQAEQVAAMRKEMSGMEALIKDLGAKYAQAKQGEGVRDGLDGNVSQREDGSIVLTVAGAALFDSGKAELKAGSEDKLAQIAKTIKGSRFANNYIRIEGHTDSTPIVHVKNSFKDNMALSIARARSVYDCLAKKGLSPNKMYTAGYGEHQPLAHPEKTAADRAKNRRVEIVIMPNNLKVQKESLAKK